MAIQISIFMVCAAVTALRRLTGEENSVRRFNSFVLKSLQCLNLGQQSNTGIPGLRGVTMAKQFEKRAIWPNRIAHQNAHGFSTRPAASGHIEISVRTKKGSCDQIRCGNMEVPSSTEIASTGALAVMIVYFDHRIVWSTLSAPDRPSSGPESSSKLGS